MVLPFLTRTRAPDPPDEPAEPELEPVVLGPEHEVEQPTAPSAGRRALALAAVSGIGLGAVTWFGVIPAVAGSGEVPVDALPTSSVVAQAAPAVETAGTPAGRSPLDGPVPSDASAPPAGSAAPAEAARAAGPGSRSAPGGPPRDPFAPLASVAEVEEEGTEPVAVTPEPETPPGPEPSATPTPSPAAGAGPAPGRLGVEFSGEPVVLRLLTATPAVAEQPGEVRVSVDGLVLQLQPGESFAALALLAVGDPCGAFQIAGQPFVLCEGQERTLRFGS